MRNTDQSSEFSVQAAFFSSLLKADPTLLLRRLEFVSPRNGGRRLYRNAVALGVAGHPRVPTAVEACTPVVGHARRGDAALGHQLFQILRGRTLLLEKQRVEDAVRDGPW